MQYIAVIATVSSVVNDLLGHPTQLSADFNFTTDSSFFFFFSSATLRARWTELNQNRSHARKWVQFKNACPKSGLSYLPTNRGHKTTIFDHFTT